jgi:hypothetical protein
MFYVSIIIHPKQNGSVIDTEDVYIRKSNTILVNFAILEV